MSVLPGADEGPPAEPRHRGSRRVVPEECPWPVVGVSVLFALQAVIVTWVSVSLFRYALEEGDCSGCWSDLFFVVSFFLLAAAVLFVSVGWKLTRGRRGWRVVALLLQFAVVSAGYSMHQVREWLDCDMLSTGGCFDEGTSLAIERTLTVGVLVLLGWALYGSRSVRHYFATVRRSA